MSRGDVPAAVLGATGVVGQRLVRLLSEHPWLRPTELLASGASAGGAYREAVDWIQDAPIPEGAAGTVVGEVGEPVEAELVFSALPSGVAGPVEDRYADAGKLVVTNARDHRMDPDVPLVVPEVNPGHLALAERQERARGRVVANPNCSAIGLTLALAPLAEAFGLRDVQVVTLQALSGAGVPGVSSLEIQDNVIPRVGGEEEKLGREPHKILGDLDRPADGGAPAVEPARFRVSAQCNRVAVTDGHLQSVSVRLGEGSAPDDLDRVRRAWNEFEGPPRVRELPSAPDRPVRYVDEAAAPQPRRHRGEGNGMTATVGRLERCPVLDLRFVTLSHNAVRGAAGGAVLTAEAALARAREGSPGARTAG